MGFRGDFLGTGLSCGEWNFVPGERTFALSRELWSEVRGALKTNLESGMNRLIESHADQTLVSEINYHIILLDQQMAPQPEHPQNDDVPERESAELAQEVQKYCDYLGPQLCRIRWAAERLVSSRIFKALADTLEPRFRQYFEHGIREFDAKDYNDAFDNMSRVLLANPNHYFACQYLGFLCVQQDDPEATLKHFEMAYKCAETERHRALALSHIARAQLALGKAASAAEFAKAAAENDESAVFWHEYALYSTLAGQSEAALRALTKALQKDWTYWAIVVANRQFDTLQPHLNSILCEIRGRVSQKARQAIDDLKRHVETARRTGAAESLIKVLLQIDEFEAKYEQRNIYHLRDLVSEAANTAESVLTLAKETVKQRIAFWRKALKRAEMRREKQIAQILEPVKQLKNEQKYLVANYKPWEAGCISYLLLWLACLAPVLLFLLQRPWQESYVLLYLTSAVIPFFVPPIINKFRYLRAVEQPHRQIEERIRIVERQVRPTIEELEREHADRKRGIESEIKDMEQLSAELEAAGT